MKLAEELKKVIINIAKKGTIQLLSGIAKDVTEKDFTLIRDGFTDLENVSLTAFPESENKFLTIPKVDSTVLVGLVDGVDDPFLLGVSEVESVTVKVAKGMLKLDKEGYLSFERESHNLLQLVLDLILEIKKIVVVQGTSPDIPALTDIEKEFKQILKPN